MENGKTIRTGLQQLLQSLPRLFLFGRSIISVMCGQPFTIAKSKPTTVYQCIAAKRPHRFCKIAFSSFWNMGIHKHKYKYTNTKNIILKFNETLKHDSAENRKTTFFCIFAKTSPEKSLPLHGFLVQAWPDLQNCILKFSESTRIQIH